MIYSRPIVKYVIKQSSQYGTVTPMKLQKLLYYLKAWGLVAGYETVPLSFEKWDYGPVNRSLYNKYRSYGSNAITVHQAPRPSEWSAQVNDTVDMILASYAPLSAFTLSALTHQEIPWRETSRNEIISEERMQSYYQTQRFAKNFPFNPKSGPFYPIESNLSYAYALDMSEREAEESTVYPSYQVYLRHRREAGEHIEETVGTFESLISE